MASLFMLLILPYSGMRIFPQKGYRTSFFISMQKFVNNFLLCNEHIVIAYNLAFVMIYNSRVFIFLQAIHQFLNAVLFYKSGKSPDPQFTQHASLAREFCALPASGKSLLFAAAGVLAPFFLCTTFAPASGAFSVFTTHTAGESAVPNSFFRSHYDLPFC
jgi:hypothetical protein